MIFSHWMWPSNTSEEEIDVTRCIVSHSMYCFFGTCVAQHGFHVKFCRKNQKRRAIPWLPQAALHKSPRRSRRNWWPWQREAARMALVAIYANRRRRRVGGAWWSKDSMKHFKIPRFFLGVVSLLLGMWYHFAILNFKFPTGIQQRLWSVL